MNGGPVLKRLLFVVNSVDISSTFLVFESAINCASVINLKTSPVPIIVTYRDAKEEIAGV